MKYLKISDLALKTFLSVIEKCVPYPFPWKNPFESEVLSSHGIQWIEFQADEEVPACRLTGWACKPSLARGTVLLLHGFRENCYNLYIVEAAERFVRQNYAVIAINFRNHGKSESRIPTLGMAESLDVSGAMTWAESNDFPVPFILHGGSMGAMAAQICTMRDKRVSGAFLKSCPASAPVALKNFIQISKKSYPSLSPFNIISTLINQSYEYDVMKWGCVDSYDSSPTHRPLVFYAMGEFDEYGYRDTMIAYNHWYSDENSVSEVPPVMATGQKKWFRTAWCGYHDFGLNHYPEMHTDVDQFFEMIRSIQLNINSH
jgi:pimeloyl-ACP methyl ester carboxylesterase